ncbi:hypothetical protein P9274_20170 [Schinkia azotoformans]|uniref:hypothetical protein n=1 Tax=Schinkia azotoformans TaxID=1454 RepID=UPI002E1A82E3|nr:hypothetical protein [Schinkia azotoformans]
MNFDLSIYQTTLIPAIIFIIWIAGQTGLSKKFFPLLALLLGIAAGLVFIGVSPEGVVTGILIAAAAVGFHSGTKNVIEGGKEYVEKRN